MTGFYFMIKKTMDSIDVAKNRTEVTWKRTRFTRSSKNMKVIKGFFYLESHFLVSENHLTN
jgi:hypothetical protein